MSTRSTLAAFLAIALSCCSNTRAAIVGTNVPAQPLTQARITALPPEQRSVWQEYLDRSVKQMQADRDFFRDEMKRAGVRKITIPPLSKNAKSVPLNNPDNWYDGADARRIADIVVSFQTPAGGWSKNLNLSKHLRVPGESFGTDNNSKLPGENDYDAPPDPAWHYIGTFDNNATITELRYLAKIITTTRAKDAKLRQSFVRGMDYIFNSQYPSGGWPQVWPLEGGYHDAITINDNAMLIILKLLLEVAQGTGDYSFAPPEVQARAQESFKKGIDCLLAAQIRANGKRTVWCQQHDPITLQPVSARNFEMPAATSSESAEIILFFMLMPNPSPEMIGSVRDAAAWFLKTRINGKAYKLTGISGRHLINAPDGTAIWPRYSEIGTDRPIFGDRDKTIHDNIDDISKERRNGYGWYQDTAKRMLEHYARWSLKYGK